MWKICILINLTEDREFVSNRKYNKFILFIQNVIIVSINISQHNYYQCRQSITDKKQNVFDTFTYIHHISFRLYTRVMITSISATL